MRLKIDLHVHTCYSYDCGTSIEDLIAEALRKRLDGIAITDHDTTEGFRRAYEFVMNIKPEHRPVIVPGIEVTARGGHVIGLCVTEDIPKGLSVEETIERIHETGGIAIAAHPPSPFKDGVGLSPKILSMGFDAIEVINSALFPFRLLVKACREFAEKHNIPQTAGSDSHVMEAVGLAYTIIDVDDRKISSIIESIRRGLTKPVGVGMPLTLRIKGVFRRRRISSALDRRYLL